LDAVRRWVGDRWGGRAAVRTRGWVCRCGNGAGILALAILQHEFQTPHEPAHEAHDRVTVAGVGLLAAVGQPPDVLDRKAFL
jgi:hypothetical protein